MHQQLYMTSQEEKQINRQDPKVTTGDVKDRGNEETDKDKNS